MDYDEERRRTLRLGCIVVTVYLMALAGVIAAIWLASK